MAIVDIEQLPAKKSKVVDFISKADLTSKAAVKKGGRPKKNDAQKATEQVFINLTGEQKEKLSMYAQELGVSVSTAIKMILTKEGVL